MTELYLSMLCLLSYAYPCSPPRRRLVKILRILIPSVFSPEVAYMVLVAVMLVVRTYCDVWMIQNGTAVEA